MTEIKIILPFIAGIVAAYVAFWNAERKITIDNITKERAKWREKIRETALEVHKAIISGNKEQVAELKSRFRLLLNPEDEEDNKILKLICIKDENERDEKGEMFSICVSYLLKHDWERAKLESKSLFKRLRFFHDKESNSTNSKKLFVKFSYWLFYHPKRTSDVNISKSANKAN
jgi:hypothetical protein